MTQSEYDEQMKAIKREQAEMHKSYDEKQQELDDQIADITKQILSLKAKIVDFTRMKQRLAQTRYRLDHEFKLRKSELAIDHPKESMEPERDDVPAVLMGHAVQDELV